MNQAYTPVALDVAIADIKAAFFVVHSSLQNSHGVRFADAFVTEHRNALLEAFLSTDLEEGVSQRCERSFFEPQSD